MALNPSPLEGKKALVTGGKRRIGRGIALALAEAGCDVGINDLNHDEDAENTLELLRKMGVKAEFYSADISSSDQVDKLFTNFLEDFGCVDILVNNAGSAPLGLIGELGDEVWQSCFDLKLMGYVRCSRAVMGGMRGRKWGRIINIIGRGGHFPTAKYIAGGAINAAILNAFRA